MTRESNGERRQKTARPEHGGPGADRASPSARTTGNGTRAPRSTLCRLRLAGPAEAILLATKAETGSSRQALRLVQMRALLTTLIHFTPVASWAIRQENEIKDM